MMAGPFLEPLFVPQDGRVSPPILMNFIVPWLLERENDLIICQRSSKTARSLKIHYDTIVRFKNARVVPRKSRQSANCFIDTALAVLV